MFKGSKKRFHMKALGCKLLFSAVLLVGSAGSAAEPTSPSAETLAVASQLLVATRFVERRLAPPNVDAIVHSQEVDCLARSVDARTQVDCAKEAEHTRLYALRLVASYPQRRVEMVQAAARIYATHFSLDDLKKATAFYESDLGQRLVAASPSMDEELVKEQRLQALRALADEFVPTNDRTPKPQPPREREEQQSITSAQEPPRPLPPRPAKSARHRRR